MKILFITATNLGDGVLSTGALDHFIRLYPEADITVACGPMVAGLFAPAPGVRKVISLKKEPYAGHWLKLARQTFGQKWDVVVDLRNSLLSRLLLADRRHIWSRHNNHQHKVEQIAAVLGASPPPSPKLWLDESALSFAKDFIPDGAPVLAIAPAARWKGKTWPAENFSALAEKLTADEGPLTGAKVAVFAAPGEEETARRVLYTVPEDRRIDAIARTTPLQAAAAIQRCTLYVGNDSGLTHTAAAVGARTLGLFGPTPMQLYRPWGPRAACVTTPETPEQLTGYEGYQSRTAPSLMTTLTVNMAYEGARRLLID